MAERPDEYLIMDGRAFHDIDDASVLEACGTKCPRKSYVEREWGENNAIVRCTSWDGKAFTKSEIVWDAKP